jgi:hypothetical protein
MPRWGDRARLTARVPRRSVGPTKRNGARPYPGRFCRFRPGCGEERPTVTRSLLSIDSSHRRPRARRGRT